MKDGFIFYGSFWDAIKGLDDANRLIIYDAVCEYALTGEIPDISGVALAMFKLIKPQIDANNKRREAGRKGGYAKAEANSQQDDSEDLANPSKDLANSSNELAKYKDKGKDKEKDKDKDKAKEKEKREKIPTLEEVREYCRERNSSVNPDTFYEYFQKGNWKDSNGNPVRNWKQKLLTWESYNNGNHGKRASPVTNTAQQRLDEVDSWV